MFDLDIMASTITLMYIKMPLIDFLVYFGALIGLYKNYRANMSVYTMQLEGMNLTKEQKKEAIKIARYKYIRDNAKVHYMKIRRITKLSPNKLDDKLLKYVKSFYSSMTEAFGESPTEDEIKQMVQRSRAIHEEVKLVKEKNEV